MFFSASGHVRVAGNQRHVGVSTGGGGNGDPRERDVERVRRDIRDGLISRATAENVFGVIVSGDIDPVVDDEATAQKRREIPARPATLVEPLQPNASRWLDENMGPNDTYLLNPKL